VSLFSEIEKTIERGFRRWTAKMFGEAKSDELLLVHHAILEEIEGQVQTAARGRRLFPFSRVTVTLIAAEETRRTMLEAAFAEDRRLEGDVRRALEGAGCELPRGFSVEVQTSEVGEGAFEIEYGAKPAEEPPPAPATGRLVVLKGKAGQPEYTLEKARMNIGRNMDLTDAEQRVIRRNDIVFEEGADEANATVSRKHAHIRLVDGEYRICDDASEYGTRVFREGRVVEVPAGNRRGEKLRAGDEIYLGRACVRFER